MWFGKANRLSHSPMTWESIELVLKVCHTSESKKEAVVFGNTPPSSVNLLNSYPFEAKATQMIRQRRSAVEMDGVTSITEDEFYTMLEKTCKFFVY